jgi:hypothetical protein
MPETKSLVRKEPNLPLSDPENHLYISRKAAS